MAKKNLDFKLFLLGFFTLFLELIFIRYLPSNIWNLGYFPNLILLGVFVGMGLGFVAHNRFTEEKSFKFFALVPALLLGLVAFVMAFRPDIPGFSNIAGSVAGELYFTSNLHTENQFSNVLLIPVWFMAIIFIFATITQYTAKIFAALPPLRAYTLDILGSCAGIVTFIGISSFQLPAWVWFLALLPIYLCLAGGQSNRKKMIASGMFVITAFLIFMQDSRIFQEIRGFKPISEFVWSPYQRVKYKEPHIFVNGIGHQEIMFSSEDLKKSFYQFPYTDRAQHPELPPYKRVLIIGAGSGNDVSAALKNNADFIDAVEIDPAIAEMGKKHNVLQPYKSDKVRLTIDDGRSFLTRADGKYDLIILALTDSLVKISPMAQLRLENYLFTRNTVERAFSLLNRNGSLVMYNAYREDWLIDKLKSMMYLGSGGRMPEVLLKDGTFAVLKVTNTPTVPVLSSTPSFINPALELPSDDWPFLYLKNREIPSFYILSMGGLIFLVMLTMAFLERSQSKVVDNRQDHSRSNFLRGAFVLMGVAFLLLETKSVIQFSLLFGTTWLNSSLVFLAVLVSVLAANWTARAIQKEFIFYLAFGLLMVACAISYQYPIANLLYYENKMLRFILASVLTFSPIFFANLIFSIAFQKQKTAEHYFGWNLIGSTLGGILEYSSMAIGYHSLTLLVAVCYVGAFLMLVIARSKAPLEWSQAVQLKDATQ